MLEEEASTLVTDKGDNLQHETSISSVYTLSEISISEEKSEDDGETSSRTENTESQELLQVFETLEREAMRQGRGDESVGEMELPEIMKMLESQESGPGDTSKMDVSNILELVDMFDKFEKENGGQKAVITQLQNENKKLSLELKDMKDREKRTRAKHWEEVSSLRTQVAQLKLNAPDPGSETGEAAVILQLKSELARVREESLAKSKQVVELTKELSVQRKNLTRSQGAGSPNPLAGKKTGFQAKEAEYQKEIRRLQKQVRALQRILYSKEPGSAKGSVSMNALSVGDENTVESKAYFQQPSFSNREVELLQSRVVELESALAAADSDSKEKIKEFQHQLAQLKEKDRSSQEKHKEEVSRLLFELEGLKAAYDFGQDSPNTLLKAEIEQLKQELETKSKQVTRYGLELSKLKNSMPRGRNSQVVDKSTAVILEEKEAEYQRKLKKLENQVRTLQRILYHKDPASLPAIMNQSASRPAQAEQEGERQQYLETRVADLEHQLKLYAAREKSVLAMKTETEDGEKLGKALIGELRARLVSQMKLVTCLKENLTATKAQLAEVVKEKGLQDFRIRELSQELSLAKTLSKPENQILADLTETVQSLNSRYFYREKELDNLISRLAVKSLTSSYPPPHASNSTSTDLDLNSNNQSSLALLLGNETKATRPGLPKENDVGVLSPTTALYLLGESADEILLLNQ